MKFRCSRQDAKEDKARRVARGFAPLRPLRLCVKKTIKKQKKLLDF
jgi:hypothetical protein